MLEFYQAYATYEDLMLLTEELFARTGARGVRRHADQYQGQTGRSRPVASAFP